MVKRERQLGLLDPGSATWDTYEAIVCKYSTGVSICNHAIAVAVQGSRLYL